MDESIKMNTIVIVCMILGVMGAKHLPEQIHLSLGRTPEEMAITWTTYVQTESIVLYAKSREVLHHMARGSCQVFVDGGPLKRVHYVHRVLLVELEPFTTYYYKCGDAHEGWSETKTFRSLSSQTNWSPRLLVYGDLGLVNGRSIPRITQEVKQARVDAVLHIGDLAYDLDSNNSLLGDAFMRAIEPIAAQVPYLTCPGNHEFAYNFSNYENRFTMYDMHHGERSAGNHFYTFTLGAARLIMFSSEFYYFVEYGLAQLYYQYLWLEKILVEANKASNRARWPWIITLAHRPMYCSNQNIDDCTRRESFLRKGLPVFKTFGLEDLFYRHGVDIELWAHEHSYERLWPLYDLKVLNGSKEQPYTNPRAPVHIITGSAGCDEDLDRFKPNPASWSAVRIADYGYTRLTIVNESHVHVEQISDEQDGKIIDEILIIQTTHGPRKPSPAETGDTEEECKTSDN